MAHLAWRRNGWELRYRDPSGRQRVERFPGVKTRKPPAEATERLAAVERQLRWREYVGPEQRAVTFGEYYERWAASRQISATKRHTDDGRARLHVLPYWRDWRVGDIRPTDIDDWIAMLSKKMGPWSVRHCYALLRGPLRRAVKDRVITDPCIDIVLPKKPEIRKTFDDVLTATEVDRLVEALADVGEKYCSLRTNGRYGALVFMGAWLGPRWNEAIGLRICDLDMLRREVTFGRLVVNQNGSRTFTERGSKTDDWRTVPAPKPVIDMLAEHITRYVETSDREAFLFTTNRGTHPLRSNFAHELRKAAGPRWPRRATCDVVDDAAHRGVVDVRRWDDAFRGATAPRAQGPDPDREGLHAPDARTLRRRSRAPRDVHGGEATASDTRADTGR